MRTIRQTSGFKRDLKREARGQHRRSLQTDFRKIVEILARDLQLPGNYRDHALAGDWKDHRDCHIKPRTNTHMSTVIQLENLSKYYRLGLIGGGTLREDLNRWWAKARGRPDPLLKIGETDHGNRVGGEVWALRDVSIQVREAEILGTIGRPGAGKVPCSRSSRASPRPRPARSVSRAGSAACRRLAPERQPSDLFTR